MTVSPTTSVAERSPAAIQRRTLAVLVLSQALGGVGIASGIAVMTLLAEEVLGSPDLAGLSQTAQVVGAAAAAFLLAGVMSSRGRRPGLTTGYALGASGALLAIVAGVAGSFLLLIVAATLLGSSVAAGSLARYAATDLADESRRGTALSLVLWAATIGAVAGPNLVGFAADAAESLGIPRLTGPFGLSLTGFAAAALVLTALLRPDPLLLARDLSGVDPAESRRRVPLRAAPASIAARPDALLAVTAMSLAHTVMVSVMVMTPLHMQHGGASLEVVGFVISLHIAGMFGLSPVIGWLADRAGARIVVLVGSAILIGSVALAGFAPEGHSTGLTVGLFLLGLGWSCCIVAGSSLLTSAVPMVERPSAQGAADLAMGVCAALGGAVAGLVVGTLGYPWLNAGAGVLAGCVALAVAIRSFTREPEHRSGRSAHL